MTPSHQPAGNDDPSPANHPQNSGDVDLRAWRCDGPRPCRCGGRSLHHHLTARIENWAASVMASCETSPRNGQRLASTGKSLGSSCQAAQQWQGRDFSGLPSRPFSVSGYQFRSVSSYPVSTNHKIRRSLGPPPQCQCLKPTKIVLFVSGRHPGKRLLRLKARVE